MVPLTRRRFLLGTTALVSGLAGCNGSDVDGPPTRRRGENVERNPDSHVLRSPTDEMAAWFVPRKPYSTSNDGSSTVVPPENAHSRGLIATAESAGRISFADIEGAKSARRFVEETDFDRETLYFEQRTVEECYRLELCYVTWSQTEIDTQYGNYYRDADVSCRVDTDDTEAWFIRVPDVLDPEQVSSHGSGWSSTGCRYPRHMRTSAEESTTENTDLGPAYPTNTTEAEMEGDR